MQVQFLVNLPTYTEATRGVLFELPASIESPQTWVPLGQSSPSIPCWSYFCPLVFGRTTSYAMLYSYCQRSCTWFDTQP